LRVSRFNRSCRGKLCIRWAPKPTGMLSCCGPEALPQPSPDSFGVALRPPAPRLDCRAPPASRRRRTPPAPSRLRRPPGNRSVVAPIGNCAGRRPVVGLPSPDIEPASSWAVRHRPGRVPISLEPGLDDSAWYAFKRKFTLPPYPAVARSPCAKKMLDVTECLAPTDDPASAAGSISPTSAIPSGPHWATVGRPMCSPSAPRTNRFGQPSSSAMPFFPFAIPSTAIRD